MVNLQSSQKSVSLQRDFIVLDLRLTKVGARRCSFFYAYTLGFLKKNGIFVNLNTLKKHCHEKAHYSFIYKHT